MELVLRKDVEIEKTGLFSWRACAELVRSRIFYKMLDAALTAGLQAPASRPAYLKTILSPNGSNYERMAAFINLLDSCFPGSVHDLVSRLYSSRQFPFAATEVQLMSYGSGATVFLIKLQDGSRDWVFKVFRRSLGKQGSSLEQIARIFQSKHETVRKWYGGQAGLVPPAHILILHGPILGSPVAGILQAYIYGERSDFFKDYTDAALLQLMKEHPELRAQFLFFAERTLAVYEQDNLCVDFLGHENLMLAQSNGDYRLQVVDNGIFNMTELKARDMPAYEKLSIYLERIRQLQGALG